MNLQFSPHSAVMVDLATFQSGILAQISDAIVAVDLNQRITYWNQGAEQLFGWTAQQVLGCPIQQVCQYRWLHPEAEQQAAQAIATFGNWRGEMQHIKSTGEILDVDVSISSLQDEAKLSIGWLAIIRDIRDRIRARQKRQQAEAALLESQALNQALISAIPDLMVRLTRQGIYLNVFPGKELAPIYPASQLTGRSLAEVLPPEVTQQSLYFIDRALQTDEVQIYEYQLSVADDLRDYEARIVAIGADEVLAIIRDISEAKRRDAAQHQAERERQQAEEALSRSEERFRSLVQNSSDIVVVVATNGDRTYVSPSVTHILGYQPEALLDKNAFDDVHPDDLAATRTAFLNTFQHPELPVRIQFRFRHANGSWVDLECVGNNMLANPAIAGIVVNLRDVSDRVRVEADLRRLNETLEEQVAQQTAELQTFLNSLPDYIFVVEQGQMRMPYCNDQIAHSLGVTSRHEIQGKTIFEVFPPENAAYFAQQNLKVFESGETLHLEEQFDLLAGRLYLDTYKVPLKKPNGEVYALIGASRNIRELVLAREALAARTRQLEATNRELDSFSYSVSHDLRAPLRHINGFVGMLRQQLEKIGVISTTPIAASPSINLSQPASTQIMRCLQVIQDSSQDMGRLIDGLLTLSRTGRREMKLRPTDLGQLVEQAIALVKTQLSDDAHPVEVTIGNLPTIQADPVLLQQVFTNLIDNAIKFSRYNSTPQVTIGTLPDGTIFIRDNGVGFAMQYADQLFGAFQRLHSQADFEGAGIGLAIVQRIVNRHGGTIWAESEPSQGACFYLQFGKPPHESPDQTNR